MMRNNLLVSIILLFKSLTKTLEVDNTNNVSQESIVFHYDCTKMQNIRKYSLNKVLKAKFHLKICILLRLIYTLPKKLSHRLVNNSVFCQCACFSTHLWNVLAYVVRA